MLSVNPSNSLAIFFNKEVNWKAIKALTNMQEIQKYIESESSQNLVDSWKFNLSQICLQWSFMFGFHISVQHAKNPVNHFHFCGPERTDCSSCLYSKYTTHSTLTYNVKSLPENAAIRAIQWQSDHLIHAFSPSKPSCDKMRSMLLLRSSLEWRNSLQRKIVLLNCWIPITILSQWGSRDFPIITCVGPE